MTTIYFVRHGEALGNARKTWQGGGTDHPLTEKGCAQGALLAKRMEPVALDAIFTSPLVRARQTADFIAAGHPGVPVEVAPALQEIDVGDMEDIPFPQAKVLYPTFIDAWDNHHASFVGPGTTDGGVPGAWVRLQSFLREVTARYPEGAVLLTAHGGILRLFNLLAQNLPLDQVAQMDWGANTCVSCALFDRTLHGQVKFLNDESHVSPALSTKDVWTNNQK